jgi:hypothetical protein
MYTTLTQPKQRGKHPKRPHSTLPERQRARRRCASGSVCVAQCVCKGWRDHALCVRTDGRPPITTLQQRTLQTKACYKHRRPHPMHTPPSMGMELRRAPPAASNSPKRQRESSWKECTDSTYQQDGIGLCQGWGVGKSIFL